jgi:hypothetical protein
VEQRLVRDCPIDQLRHQACARSLWLVTVADAHGLRDYAEKALGQRLSRTSAELHSARHALITRGLVASRCPLYQVFALGTDPLEATPSASPVAADDERVDLQAMFARLWEV